MADIKRSYDKLMRQRDLRGCSAAFQTGYSAGVTDALNDAEAEVERLREERNRALALVDEKVATIRSLLAASRV